MRASYIALIAASALTATPALAEASVPAGTVPVTPSSFRLTEPKPLLPEATETVRFSDPVVTDRSLNFRAENVEMVVGFYKTERPNLLSWRYMTGMPIDSKDKSHFGLALILSQPPRRP